MGYSGIDDWITRDAHVVVCERCGGETYMEYGQMECLRCEDWDDKEAEANFIHDGGSIDPSGAGFP